MSQHDLTIANQGFPAFRADLNDALQALGSNQSGTSAPSPTFANQLWYDTTNNQLKQRNEDNDAWIVIAELDQTTDTLIAIGGKTLPAGSIIGSSDSQTLTNKTLTNPVINGFTGDTSIINIGTNQFYKDANGHIGIGAVPSAWGSLNKGLDLKGYTGIGEIAAVNSPVFSCNAYHNGSNWVYKNTNPVSFYQLNGNQHDWYIAPSGTAGTAVSPVAAMGIDASANLSFNSGYGSSAKAYGCRAWVNYNQATGAPIIRGSANISSLTDLGNGQARVNFTTAMPNVNYSVVAVAGSDATNTDIWHVKLNDAPGHVYTTSFKLTTIYRNNSTAQDYSDLNYVSAAVFR